MSESTYSPAERKLMDLIEHGDDFLKIELLRPALSYYRRALEMSPGNKEIERKITDCERLLVIERRVIWILTAFGVIAVVAILLL